MASGPITSWQIYGETVETVTDFWAPKITADGDCSHEIKRHLLLGRKVMTNLDSIWKSRNIILPTKFHLVKGMIFPVVMYGCESWKSWAPKNCCFWTVVLEKTLESPLDCKEIQPVHPKGTQSWMFIGSTNAEAETPRLWPPDAKNWLIRKDPDAGKDWRWEEKGTTEDKMVGWYHQLDGHDFEQALGASWWWSGKPGMLQSLGSQSTRQIEQLNWTEPRKVSEKEWIHVCCCCCQVASVVWLCVTPCVAPFVWPHDPMWL